MRLSRFSRVLYIGLEWDHPGLVGFFTGLDWDYPGLVGLYTG